MEEEVEGGETRNALLLLDQPTTVDDLVHRLRVDGADTNAVCVAGEPVPGGMWHTALQTAAHAWGDLGVDRFVFAPACCDGHLEVFALTPTDYTAAAPRAARTPEEAQCALHALCAGLAMRNEVQDVGQLERLPRAALVLCVDPCDLASRTALRAWRARQASELLFTTRLPPTALGAPRGSTARVPCVILVDHHD